MKCSGNPKDACGGYYKMNVYQTGLSSKLFDCNEMQDVHFKSSIDDMLNEPVLVNLLQVKQHLVILGHGLVKIQIQTPVMLAIPGSILAE